MNPTTHDLPVPLVTWTSALPAERWTGGPLPTLWATLKRESLRHPGRPAWRVCKHNAVVGLTLNADRSATLEFQRLGPFKVNGAVALFAREVSTFLHEFGYGPTHFPIKVDDGRHASPPYLRVICTLPSKTGA